MPQFQSATGWGRARGYVTGAPAPVYNRNNMGSPLLISTSPGPTTSAIEGPALQGSMEKNTRLK
jgi:hypothetical protein